MKTINIIFMLVLSVVLIGCKKEAKIYGTLMLNTAISKIEEQNYQMDVSILIYNELQSEVIIQVDGSKTTFTEGEYIKEYYQRNGDNLVVITKEGNKYEKTEIKAGVNDKFLIFNKLEMEWFFQASDFEIKIKTEMIDNLYELISLSEQIKINGLTINFNEDGTFSKITFSLEENRDNYYMIMEFSNYGSTLITLPEVN